MPSLYVVATPIGNLEDISLRALRVLRNVKLIAAEDTRKTRKLLNAYEIKTPLTSYYEHNKLSRQDYLLHFLQAEGDVALVSEAGTPGISDPGYDLIAAAFAHRISIVPIPGPSAVITAIAVSGLPADRFTFLGFLPRLSRNRKKLLQSVVTDPSTLVILEAPHRLHPTLQDLVAVLGDRKISVCRELTKIHEEVFRGQLSQVAAHFVEPRGEFTLVIAGYIAVAEKVPDFAAIEARMRRLSRQGMPAREVVASLHQETGIPRRKLYQLWLKTV